MDISAPVAGWVMPLSEVPDAVFSGCMLGNGLAIDPTEGRIVAPFGGRIVSVHPSGHAVSLAADGVTILIHVGIDTVSLRGEGFQVHVREGDRVEPGDTLIDFDLDHIARSVPSLVTPIIVTEGELHGIPAHSHLIEAGQALYSAHATGRGRSPEPDFTKGPTLERPVHILLDHGLHARPAARLAALVQSFAARITIVAADGRFARADSPVSVLALALPHGAEVVVRAEGADASEAIDVVSGLLSSPVEETGTQPSAEQSPAIAEPAEGARTGFTASPGLAMGPVFRLAEEQRELEPDGADIPAERQALADALAAADTELRQEAGTANAAIFAAHRQLLTDPALREEAETAILAGRAAAYAWREAIEGFCAVLAGAGDDHLAGRVADLRDIERRVIGILTGQSRDLAVPRGAIILAGDLVPSDIPSLAEQGIVGIALERGGATSHAAIIAAGLGLPMLVGLGEELKAFADGTMAVLDASNAVLRVDISAEEQDSVSGLLVRNARRRADARARALLPCFTRDGRRVEVFANLGSLSDARLAVAEGAEGCGLLRTEFLFHDRETSPGRDEQRAVYQSIADALDGRPLIVRTLDIGADKPARWLPMAVEDNPALGLRGVRLQLAHPHLLRDQLAALVGLRGDVKIMVPMITDIAELRAVRSLLAELAAEASVPMPPLGIMVETPAAALMAAMLAAEADFLSIGTNDLTQYLLAADRTNPAVSALADALHPAVLRSIAATVAGAEANGRWTGLCGGLAAEEAALPLLVGLGLTELSVPPPQVAMTKAAIRALDFGDCAELARRALAAPDAAAVRALLDGEGSK